MKVSLSAAGLTLLLIGTSLPGQQEDLSSMESQLKNFEFRYGLAGMLGRSSLDDFLQLVDDQQIKIAKIKKKYVRKAGKIRDSKELKPEERLEKMMELRKPLDEELERVLLPHQKKLLAGYGFYSRVNNEGLVNSMLRGEIARELELSDSEIRAMKAAAEEMYREYRQAEINAQQTAIAKLVVSYPEEKQDQLKQLLAPMLDGNGLIKDDIVRTTFQITDPPAVESELRPLFNKKK